jgi:uncharacterized membrane protein YgcG
MEALGWLVAYVLGFALVQLLLYRYIQRDDASPDAAPGSIDRSARRPMEQSSARSGTGDDGGNGGNGGNGGDGGDGEEGVHCRHCGTVNDYEQQFAYCRECVQPLQ